MIEINPVIVGFLSSRRNSGTPVRHVRFSHPTHDKTVGAIVESNRRLKNTSKFLDLCSALELIREEKIPDRVTILLCAGTVIEHEGEIIVPCIIRNQTNYGAKYYVGFRRHDQKIGPAFAVGIYE